MKNKIAKNSQNWQKGEKGEKTKKMAKKQRLGKTGIWSSNTTLILKYASSCTANFK